MKRIGLIAVILLILGGCAKFKDGDCIQNIKDGFIWRITRVGFSQYTLQGWNDGKWGLAVDGKFNAFDSRYVKITCPFSTHTIQEK